MDKQLGLGARKQSAGQPSRSIWNLHPLPVTLSPLTAFPAEKRLEVADMKS